MKDLTAGFGNYSLGKYGIPIEQLMKNITASLQSYGLYDVPLEQVMKSISVSLRSQIEFDEDIVAKICHQVLRTPGEFPKLDLVADGLSMGARTLRRRLRALGTSYQRILDDVKKEMAIVYLQATSLSVQEISELLGYSEVTNFRRAFMKWVDLSPYQFRQQFAV